MADMLHTTAAQIGRYKAIHNNLTNENLKEAFNNGELKVSAAYEASKLDAEGQAAAAEKLEANNGLSISDVKEIATPTAPQMMDFSDDGTETTYTFDQEGHLTKIDSNQASDIFSELKRDKQGRLLSYVAGDFDCYEASRYTYDSTSGLLKTISNECPDSGSDVTTYIYDNKGYAVKMEVKGSRGEMGEELEPYESAKTFTYDGFDSKGNWTLRKGKDSTEKTEWTETRIITYFE